MLDNYRIVCVVPAGRRRYLEILLPYILDQRELLDELRFWVNTGNSEDRAYLQDLAAEYPDFVHLDDLLEGNADMPVAARVRLIRHFFKKTVDPGTVYIRLDDDICWIHPEAIPRLLRFRIDHPEYFLIYPALINNGRTLYIHQVMGHIPTDILPGFPGQHRDKLGLLRQSPHIAEIAHETLLGKLSAGQVEDLMFGRFVISNYERVPINCIAWFGREFAKFDGVVGDEVSDWQEEKWLAEMKPAQISKPCCIWGQSLMAHFAYHTQEKWVLEQTLLLEKYRLLSQTRHLGDFAFLP